MMKFLIIKLLIIVLLANSCNSEIFSINADKCTNLGCTFSSLFTSSLPKITDDVVFFTSNPLIQSTIILSNQISIKSLNITNGILKIASSGSLSVSSNILIAAGGSLMLDGMSSCNSLTVNGNLYINSQSSLSVTSSLSIASGIFESNGTLNLGSLNIQSGITAFPKFFGSAVVTLNGDSNINTSIQLLDTASLIIKSGICTIKGLLASSTASIENRSKLFFGNIIGDLVCKVNSISGSTIQFSSSNIQFHNVITTDTTTINLIDSSVTIHSLPTTISLGSLSIDATSKIILDKTNCTIASLKSTLNSIIKLTNSSNFNINKPFDFNCDLDIDPTSSIFISATTPQVVNFYGNILSAIGSTIKLDYTCNFNKPVLLDSLLLGSNSAITFVKNSTIIKDFTCPSTASINIDKNSGSLTIGGNSNIDTNLNLNGVAQLNIVASTDSSVTNKVCTIKQITTGSDAILNIGTGVNVNILTPSIFGNSIHLNGDANLQINGNVSLNGLTIFPIEGIKLPTLQLSSSYCTLPENTDYDIIGTINLIKSTLALSNNIALNINNNLVVDSNSNIIIPADATLIVSGPSSIISSTINIDGKLNLESGSIKFDAGIASTSNSFINCNNANVNINGNNVAIGGQFSVTGAGKININSLNTIFKNGIKVPTLKTPININADAKVTISADSLISSPVFCLGNSILNILSGSNIQMDGGLSSQINSVISLEGSTLSLNSTSNIIGIINLNNSTIISSGETTISNTITSDPTNTDNNLMINSGSCTINTKNNINISGELNVLKNSLLTLNAAKTTCAKGIKNSGKIIVSNIVDTSSSIISQISGDAELVLLAGSNIISKTSASFLSGKISGTGKITSNNCQCGGIINGMISVDGSLSLLDSAVVLVNIFANNNYSKISCNGNVNVNGLIEVNLDAQASLTLKKGDEFAIITSTNSNINGTLSLSDSTNSKSFDCKKSQTGSTYNLVYNADQINTSKDGSSIEDHASASSTLFVSFNLLFISLVLLVIV
ncbi:hypothetical protein DICPUDRAFT_76895 [Dictyostelium purpureum]|uniref:Uncharacterized protein n=1 Tax=Dictyostelium purpureum TaxID=5786 RepID=F0ZEZ1_DICPU|nr:uncharacterized protein DICPUDRAFT_76895 [Dictyostelium purpureum]EGC37490.1 hypothetical protein DICPUDRAFT_76895 [Dictyostelium purpureum]|eukprot:XP_003285964.1 hypothetical protein DICPUDRAFT_76895 [Dictyostelium purpureum]